MIVKNMDTNSTGWIVYHMLLVQQKLIIILRFQMDLQVKTTNSAVIDLGTNYNIMMYLTIGQR